MKRFKIFSKKTIIAGSVIFVSFLFVLMAFAPALSGAGQTGTTATPENTAITAPMPVMNTNITWSTFNSGWSPLEYNNGTANQTLATNMSSFYKNPITVNPTDIKSKALQNDNLSTAPVWDASAWGQTSLAGGAVGTNGISGTSIYQTANTSDSAPNAVNQFFTIPETNFPSNNPNYDFITIIIQLSGPQITGVNGQMDLWNSTIHGSTLVTIYPGQYTYISESLGTLEKDEGYATTFNTTGKGTTTYLKINSQLNIPETSTAATYNMSIIGLAFGTTPMTLGTQENNGSLIQINQLNQTGRLQTFTPDFAWTSVSNSGYTVATSQQMQNVSESQGTVSNSKYVEQATYQGNFNLPTAPDLSYANSNITMPVTIPGNQFIVANLNGASFTSTLGSMKNGTFAFGSVNPNSANSIVLEVEYTAGQWNSITRAPSFFTLRGLEYYWWVGVIGLLSLIGLGAAAVSHFGGDEEDLKIPKGKFGR